MKPPLNETPQFLHCIRCQRTFPKSDLRTGRAVTSPEAGLLCTPCLELLRRDLQASGIVEMRDSETSAIVSASALERGSHRYAVAAIVLYATSYPPMLYLLRGLKSLEWGLWESSVAGVTMLCLLSSLLASILGHRTMHPFLLVCMVLLCVLNLGWVGLALMGLSPF